ncbi:hypothetical protein B0O99DRAFT_600750 [Bisporella sp. PMI_857]|nr:hypothetical protein B0O99DRAFT_600750 [Bisporella sp. PMI_857]
MVVMSELRRRKQSSKTPSASSHIELAPYSKPSVASTLDQYEEVSLESEVVAFKSSLESQKAPYSPTHHTLLVSNTGGWWMDLSIARSSSPETPIFHANNTTLSLKAPSVILSRLSPPPSSPKPSKSSKSSKGEDTPSEHRTEERQTVGILQLTVGRDNPFALTSSPAPHPSLRYSNLRRTSDWSHKTYSFPFDGKSYVWTRTRYPVWSDQPDLELREQDGDGEVLAEYKGRLRMRKRGVFRLKGRDGPRGSVDDEGFSDWEYTVLLTGCGIIEASRRRARMRRGSGGGGGGGGGGG